MAGDAQKKSAQRKQRALMIYCGIALVLNSLFFYLRIFQWDKPIDGFFEWIGVLFLMGVYAYSTFGLVHDAAAGAKSEFNLDAFAVAIVTQILQLWTGKGWPYLLLLAVPAYAAYNSWSLIAPWINMAKQQAAANMEQQNAAAEKKQAKMERQQARGGRVVYK